MYRLITFGGLSLVGDGVPVAAAANQRSRLALLAVLAVAGPSGVARDKLLACFWPDSDTDRARHALKQAVYAIRRDLGTDAAIAGTAALVLDATAVASDVREFDDAISRGDDAAAVALYGGAFLDGVFVRNAPEFDRWADAERARLQSAYLSACERLARTASSDGRQGDAAALWRHAAARDPVNGRIAVELMTALAESGDLTGAVRYASVHEELVRAELECAPDAAVLELAAKLRSGTWQAAARVAPRSAPPPDIPDQVTLGARAVERATPVDVELVPAVTRRRRRWPLAVAGGAVVATAAVLLGLPVMSGDTGRSLRTVLTRGTMSLAPRRIVVAPFTNRTGDSTLDPLGELTADWLSRRLLEANFEVVDARTSMIASRLVAGLPPFFRPRDEVVALAEETGAGTVLAGSYYLQGDSLAISATISDATRRTVVRVVGPLRASRGQSGALVEALAVRLTAALAASTDSRAGAATTSLVAPPSIDAFERTSHAWEMYFSRPADTTAVFAELARARASDSTYSAPLLMRAYVLDVHRRWGDLAEVVRSLELRRQSLGRAERAALDLFAADLNGDFVARFVASRELARLSPGSAEMPLLVAISACYLLRPRDALDALESTDPDRGINLLSPQYWAWRAAAYHLLGDLDGERSSVTQGRRRFPAAPATAVGRARVAAVKGDVAEIADVLRSERARSEPEARMLTQLAARELRAHGHPDQAAQLFARAASEPAPSASAPRAERHMYAMALYEAGRLAEARRAYGALAASDSSDVEAVGRLATVAARLGDAAMVLRLDAKLRTWSAPYSLGAPAAWRAHLAALDHRPADAAALLRIAVSQGYRLMDLDVVGVHDEPDFQTLRTDAALKELFRPRTGALQLP
ncbi:MAG: BTAD domain-containing putative transcriptional regulator [Gemmatimonadaceae bacterium]